MPERNYACLWRTSWRADLLARRERVQQSLDAIKNRESAFAAGHVEMLRLYDAALDACDSPPRTPAPAALEEIPGQALNDGAWR